MKSKFGRIVIFTPILFFVFSAFMLSQNPPVNQPKPVQTGAESLNKELIAQEEALAQSHRGMAAIYREMAVPAESDAAPIRDLKRQYARLAENEEKAALAAQKLATRHVQLAALIERSPEVPAHVNYADPAFRR